MEWPAPALVFVGLLKGSRACGAAQVSEAQHGSLRGAADSPPLVFVGWQQAAEPARLLTGHE